MTEQEAREKTCPNMMYIIYSNSNNYDKETTYSNCIASDCMMWRKMEKCHSPLGRCFGGKCLECSQYKTSGFCGFGGTP